METLTNREMTLKVAANEAAPSRSRSHLEELKRFLEPRYDDVALVISELVTNSVKHGATGDIRVMVRTTDESIRLEVRDSGTGFDTTTPRGEGMGLKIIEALADDWGISRDEEFAVWVELRRGQDSVNIS